MGNKKLFEVLDQSLQNLCENDRSFRNALISLISLAEDFR